MLLPECIGGIELLLFVNEKGHPNGHEREQSEAAKNM
jgi:hypothetical protein